MDPDFKINDIQVHNPDCVEEQSSHKNHTLEALRKHDAAMKQLYIEK